MGSLIKITPNVVRAKGVEDAKARDTVYVGKAGLLGEIVRIEGDEAEIQIYESGEGLMLGEPVVTAGGPLSMELGPGLLGGIFDGLGRPLERFGERIEKGKRISPLSEKEWAFAPLMKKGDTASPGDVLGNVKEGGFDIKIMVPPGTSGKITGMEKGKRKGKEACATIMTADGEKEIPLIMRWPVHTPIPYAIAKQPITPLLTGQRVVDVMFPLAKGGKVVLPGGFGVGKTVLGHSLAQGCDADIIVYVGCGERGNEMADLLEKFTGTPIMEKMVLIANTSNMPVAAREASIYTGATIAEFYRNMGYDALLIADSTSRWAEALREISGSMGEMPGEKGFPAYLASRIARFYERAGRAEAQGKPAREGSVTIIGMASPQGGDFSEPVTQASMQYTKALWALDPTLAYRRHFPAISWTASYSKYVDSVEGWWRENINGNWFFVRQRALMVLGKEEELRRMIQIVGKGALSDREKLLLEIAGMIKEAYLQQNAYDPVDAVCSPRKAFMMLNVIFMFYDEAERALAADVPLERITGLPVKSKIEQSKRISGKEPVESFVKIMASIAASFDKLMDEAAHGKQKKGGAEP
jgi:V/A-type H+-transporting ATPase subunit A